MLYALNPELFLNAKAKVGIIIILCLFLCFGYMTGSDWRGYEILYEDLKYGIPSWYSKERGYLYYNLLFQKLNLNFWPFFIFTKCICFLITLLFYKKYSEGKFGWGLLMFFVYSAIFAYIDNPMRNLIACVIFVFSYKYIYERNLIKYLIIVFLASTFHLSVLLISPVYFLYKIDIKRSFIYVCLTIIGVVAIGYQIDLKDYLYSSITMDIFSNGMVYVDNELEQNMGRLFSFGLLWRLFLFVLIIENKKSIENTTKYGVLLTRLSFFYIIVYLFCNGIPILGRVAGYLELPYFLSLSVLLYSRFFRYKVLLSSLIIVISFTYMYSTITSNYKYIPYTNYITYIFSEKPSFSERNEYNFRKSPYIEKK